jgi:hypothetical protein
LTQLVVDQSLTYTSGGEVGSDVLDSDSLPEEFVALRGYYGSIGASLLTLFQAITGGLNWYLITDPLMNLISPWLALLICMYIAFSLFALMNIVTGVFVESAMQTAKGDRDMFMVHFVRQLFYKADQDQSGAITWAEFKECLDLEEMNLFFQTMDLDMDEAKDLFRLLDVSCSGEVGFEDFLHGCFRLRGAAKAIDLAALMAEHGASMRRWDVHSKRVEAALCMLLVERSNLSAPMTSRDDCPFSRDDTLDSEMIVYPTFQTSV